jgi:1-acyl-sn-glycerol-3-phosphate acyltransferase
MTNTEVPQTNLVFLRFAFIVFGALFRLYFRLRFNRDRLKLKALAEQDRPLIVVFNHSSYLDVPLVALGIGFRLMSEMTLPGKKELFEDRKTRWMVSLLSVIPLDRDLADTTAVRGLLRALKHGRDILIAPEGTRSSDGTVHPFQIGFAKLAHKANALVIPVGIRGAAQAMPRGAYVPKPRRIMVTVGDPLDPQTSLPAQPDQDDFAALAEATRQAVVSLTQ